MFNYYSYFFMKIVFRNFGSVVISPLKTTPARRGAELANAGAHRLAGGTFSGRGHALNAHQTPSSADNCGIHHRGVETTIGEHCVPGAEAPATTVSCKDWERSSGRPMGPRRLAHEEEPLLWCTCVKAPADRTSTRRYLSHGLTAADRSRAGWGWLPEPVTPPKASWRSVLRYHSAVA